MSCYYCDLIAGTDSRYLTMRASFDLASEAPRCARHWRFICGACNRSAHFMSVAYCFDRQDFFCSDCAIAKKEVQEPFWSWKYYFSYQSPWTTAWEVSLDRLEYEGRHPFQKVREECGAWMSVDEEMGFIIRYPRNVRQWRSDIEHSDSSVRANWNRNSERWNAEVDENGDHFRRFYSDETMLQILGSVTGQKIIDVGSGNGYLCRKLARLGGIVTGVDLSECLVQIAVDQESRQPLGISYLHSSASTLSNLDDSEFDKAVSNYSLMNIRDYDAAIREIWRVLKPGGLFVVVLRHPCFASGPGSWTTPVPDSPRYEDRSAWQVDTYFSRGPYFGQWAGLDPVLNFHRPLRDYWHVFRDSGFLVETFEEPMISEEGRRELSLPRIDQASRVAHSCILGLVKQITGPVP